LYVLDVAGTYSRESSVSYVDVGIIIVVDVSRLRWLRKRSAAVISVRLKGLEGYRRICKTCCERWMK
jgi:hypothetical protein